METYFKPLVVGVVIGLAIQLVGGMILALGGQLLLDSSGTPSDASIGISSALNTAGTALTALAGLPVIVALVVAWGRAGKADTPATS